MVQRPHSFFLSVKYLRKIEESSPDHSAAIIYLVDWNLTKQKPRVLDNINHLPVEGFSFIINPPDVINYRLKMST